MSEQKMREALQGFLNIVSESRGVDGYHLNGDIAEWDEFPEVDLACEALAQPADVGLTDEEIDLINESNWNRKGNTWDDREFARAVIQAHEAKKNGVRDGTTLANKT